MKSLGDKSNPPKAIGLELIAMRKVPPYLAWSTGELGLGLCVCTGVETGEEAVDEGGADVIVVAGEDRVGVEATGVADLQAASSVNIMAILIRIIINLFISRRLHLLHTTKRTFSRRAINGGYPYSGLDHHYRMLAKDCQSVIYAIITSIRVCVPIGIQEDAMEASMLSTKLFIPPLRPGLVSRPRLIEQMQAALDYPLTLVSAPAGFGKTTLLSEWLHHCKTPAAWLSLDESENDPVRFWEYFSASLKAIVPDIGKTFLALLHSSQPVPIEASLIELINDISAFPGDFVLILDDFHFIQAQPIHQGVAFLLEHLPPRMHLLISTRIDPPFPLAHFRGKGMMLEIGADDLRFTLDETIGLFKHMPDVKLTGLDIKALNARCEGWIAGLKMAMLSLRDRNDTSGFIAAFTGSHRYIMDYLIEEVLQRQPPEMRDFLFQTSVLEKLNGPLCNAITGQSNCREILLNLENSKLFMVPLDESREWYRYHHLFAELLRHQLGLKYGEKKAEELHQKASRWYEDSGFPDEAIHHSLAAQSWDRAMQLISVHNLGQIMRGQNLTVINWLQKIPENILQSHHELYLLFGLLIVDRGHIETAERCADYLKKVIQDNDGVLSGRLATLKFFIARTRWDIPRAIEQGKRALSLLMPTDFGWRCTTSMYLGIIQWERGCLIEAEELMNQTYEIAAKLGLKSVAAIALGYLGVITQWRGKLHRAAVLYQQAFELDEKTLFSAFPHIFTFFLKYERNELEEAITHLQRAIELNQTGGFPEILDFAYINLALARTAKGDNAGAIEEMDKSDRYIVSPGASPLSRARNSAWHLRIARMQGGLDAILYWGNRTAEQNLEMPFYMQPNSAVIPLALGEKTKAAKQLEALVDEAVRSGRQYDVTRLRVQQALAAPADDSALAFLTEALTSAGPEGYVRTFVDEGIALAPWLRKAISRGIEPEFVRKLLGIIETEEHARRAKMRGVVTATPGLLGAREMEVLQLLADEISNEAIASRLSISLSTVKTHVHHIIEKLGVRDRSQAVFRAKELKLL
jgi:LuxR family transcriptional regulator, maltose regulon positive regulatory protein